MNPDIKTLVRRNILNLKPYSSARSEFKGEASVFLDANENPNGSPLAENYNRYPDPLQIKLRDKLAQLYGVSGKNICLGNGSDELIDHIVRIFCNPGQDEIIVCPPTFKMYEVAAGINDVAVKKVLLKSDFQLDVPGILNQITGNTKVIFLCSPNNPTGYSLREEDVTTILNQFEGIVVIDEAYADFSSAESFMSRTGEYKNLIVLRTMSKAWGLAGLRIGLACADAEIIDFILRIKMPYNVNTISQKLGLQAIENYPQVVEWRNEILESKKWLVEKFGQYSFIKEIYPGDANFLLIRVDDALKLYKYLVGEGIIIRNQSTQPLLENCVRITVGTPVENKKLINALNAFK